MLKMPSSKYTISSLQVVSRLAAYNIRLVTLKSGKEPPYRALTGIPIISQIRRFRDALLPSSSPSFQFEELPTSCVTELSLRIN
jgi:hypothetical protein